MNYLLLGAVVILIAALLLKYTLKGPTNKVPPCPRGLPLIGNLLDLASDSVHIKCREWSRQFGESQILHAAMRSATVFVADNIKQATDIISLRVLGNTIIVLNSLDAVTDIFEKKGANFSDRPDMPMIVDL